MTHLYLPITSQPRELDARLLLAAFAARAGLTPVVGYKSTLLTKLPQMAPGFYLAHNARQKPERLARIQQAGHRVIVLDEEALVRQSDDIFLKKHPEGAFDSVDGILCWGEDDQELWKRAGIAEDHKTAIVGNPRMDSLRPELAGFFDPEVDKIRQKHGRYVLLNTNFPTVNNLTPQGGGVRMASWAMDKAGKDTSERFLDAKTRLMQAEIDLIAPLAAAISPLSLVIRPHPNEDHGPWLQAVQDVPNAQVDFEGNVAAWILGSEAIIHNNCTTGIEAAVAGIPVLNFSPFAVFFDNPLCTAFGQHCRDAAELSEAIKVILNGGSVKLTQAEKARLQQHVANVDGAYSCERIVNYIQTAQQQIGLRDADQVGNSQSRFEDAKVWLGKYARLFVTARGVRKRRALKKMFPDLRFYKLDAEQLGLGVEQFDLMMRQFPPLDAEHINARLQHLLKIMGSGPALRVEFTSDYMFSVVPE